MKPAIAVSFLVASVLAPAAANAPRPALKAPVVPEAAGYAAIPNAAVPPTRAQVYRAIFDATQAARQPTQLLPALNMAGSGLNALGVERVPLENARFAIVFHGPAIDGILDESHYKAKFGVRNPNLKVLAQLKKAGVELFVCGQNLVFENIDPKTLSPDVQVASKALIVLMEYQGKGYALMSF